MSEKDKQGQPVEEKRPAAPASGGKASGKEKAKSKDDRLAEALRANLRRRKSAAKSRKES